MEVLTAAAFIFFGTFFAYMSSHLVSEKKAGKQLPFPWEKSEKIFDKSKIKYTDGDNT
tara:strand:- start:2114 stop:2287 length:174 start_codon:yes stop_codon:yes gene_type:complete